MTKADLSDVYRDKTTLPALISRTGRSWNSSFMMTWTTTLSGSGLGYREMLERDFYDIPDLCFDIQLLISDPPYIASRLEFDCTQRESSLDSM